MEPLHYIDNLAAPRCMAANRPRSSKPSPRSASERVSPATAMHELRKAVATREGWRAINAAFWSKGQPALTGPIRPLRPVVPVAQMSLQDLCDTQDIELPSISREMYDELGVEAYALDGFAVPDAPGTIAETLGNDAVQNIAVRTIKAYGDMTPEEREAYHQWVDQRSNDLARRYGTPLDLPIQEVRQRIEWEQYAAQCSPIKEHYGLKITDQSVTFFSWNRPPGLSFEDHRAAYLDGFLAKTGLDQFPKPADFIRWRNLRRQAKANPAYRLNWLDQEAFFSSLERERSILENTWGGESAWERPEEYVPSYATLVETTWNSLKPSGWLNPEAYATLRAKARRIALSRWNEMRKAAAAAQAEAGLIHRCRNNRCHGSKDEPWHIIPRDPSDTAIGTLESDAFYERMLSDRRELARSNGWDV